MEKTQRLDVGEKVFVAGFFVTFVAESLVALGSAIHFSWLAAVYGIICCVVVMYLGNWLYTADPKARHAASIWILLQIAVTALALVAFAALPADSEWFNYLPLPGPWLALLKLAAYLYWAWALMVSPTVKDMLFVKAGGDPEKIVIPSAPELVPSGVVVPLTADQISQLGTLASYVRMVGFVFLLVGILAVALAVHNLPYVTAIPRSLRDPSFSDKLVLMLNGWLPILEAVVLFALGSLLLSPAVALRDLKDKGTDLAYVMNAVVTLRDFICKQMIVTAVVMAIVVVNLIVKLLPLFEVK